MFLLHWEVYVSMFVVVDFLNEHLHWFCGKRTLIDGGVYMRLNEGAFFSPDVILYFRIYWYWCVFG